MISSHGCKGGASGPLSFIAGSSPDQRRRSPTGPFPHAPVLALLAELLSLLIPVLEAFADEAAAIGLEVNWDKTKVQALGTQQPDVETLNMHGHQVAVVEEFVYLGALTHSSVLSSYDIHRRSGLTRSAMQKSDNCI